MKIRYSLMLLALLFAGCLTPASKINVVRLGMTKAEVLAVMGPPASVTADTTAEYLNYGLAEGPLMDRGLLGSRTPYEIKLVSGKVVSYGRAGAPTPGARGAVFIPQPMPIIH